MSFPIDDEQVRELQKIMAHIGKELTLQEAKDYGEGLIDFYQTLIRMLSEDELDSLSRPH
jgi:hypothetical protein